MNVEQSIPLIDRIIMKATDWISVNYLIARAVFSDGKFRWSWIGTDDKQGGSGPKFNSFIDVLARQDDFGDGLEIEVVAVLSKRGLDRDNRCRTFLKEVYKYEDLVNRPFLVRKELLGYILAAHQSCGALVNKCRASGTSSWEITKEWLLGARNFDPEKHFIKLPIIKQPN